MFDDGDHADWRDARSHRRVHSRPCHDAAATATATRRPRGTYGYPMVLAVMAGACTVLFRAFRRNGRL